MNSLETTQEISIDDKAYQELLNEVEYRCSLCEAIHEDSAAEDFLGGPVDFPGLV